jgi:hopanoid biosynthesis associated protein HpnK
LFFERRRVFFFEEKDARRRSFLVLFCVMAALKKLIVTADDFGLAQGVNEAVELAANEGILTGASLMVGAPAFEDAVARARRTPNLHVGLHLVVIEGPSVLSRDVIPDLVGSDGWFPNDQVRMGVDYFFRPRVRRQLAREIRAQFEKFASTGLPLDHANAHKHMHLHPTVGRMMISIGREFGLRAIRIPAEPSVPGQGLGNRALRWWCRVLRAQAQAAGMRTNDWVMGLSDTGHMTPARVSELLARLPEGLTEMYFHPAIRRDATLERLMPEYEHEAEFSALRSTKVPRDVKLTCFSSA